jgi:hypothetical protein
VPFSIFPSTYKDKDNEARPQTQINTHEEVQITLPQKKPAGREGQHSSLQPSTELVAPSRSEHRIVEEEVRITREEERYRRPGSRQSERFVKEEFRPTPAPPRDYTETQVKVDSSRRYSSPVDVAEREYRERFRPQQHPQQPPQSSTGLELVPVRRPRRLSEKANKVHESTVDERTTVARPNFREEIKITEEIRESTPYPSEQSAKMGYYDEEDLDVEAHRDTNHTRRAAPSSSTDSQPNTVSIPCHHIRLGDFLMLQGRPCQVIRISTSSATGQYRYLGVDLFTKQLHEESSFIANPAPSVVVQTMLGPVFKQYRVLDLADGYVTAMTETGDVKQGLAVIDQSNLWSRLQQAFESGRGSVRVLVLNDGGRELAVEMKVIHGSRL